jgi:hypothetical protein
VTTFWVLLFALILLCPVSCLAAYFWRAELKAFSDTWGNVASVLGLWFGLIAFFVTILTLLLTAQAEKDAARKVEAAAARAEAAVREAGIKAEAAIREAEQRTAAVVERLGMQVLESGCDALGRAVRHIQELVGRALSLQEELQWKQLWQEIVVRCRECRDAGGDLHANPRLTGEEGDALMREFNGLGEIASFIERNRLPAQKNGKLPDEYAKTLDRLFGLLTEVRHRLRRQVYEVPHGSRQ